MKQFIKMSKRISSCLLLLSLAGALHAQICDYQNKVTVVLSDGTNVTLYGLVSDDKIPGTDNYALSNEYYYLPVNLRLAAKEDGTPEFLLLKYTSDERTDAGGVQGALTHFLMHWGLTADQESELQTKLTAKLQQMATTNPALAQIRNPKVMGAMDVTAEKDNSFRVISAILTDKTMATSLVCSGKAGVIPGANVAVAAKLDKDGAQLLAATLDKSRSISDVSLELSFNYKLLFPAVRGKITIDWSKFETAYQSFNATYKHDDKNTKSGDDDTYSYQEIQKLYTSAIEKKAVTIELDNNSPDDPIVAKIVAAFMDAMVAELTNKDDQQQTPAPASNDEKSADPNIKYGARYRFNRSKYESHISRKIEVFNLNYRMTVPEEAVLTENLASWYDAVRDNPKCVATVRLDDTFFQFRDINLVLSEGAEELIGHEVNYVTIDVHKKRDDGNDWNRSATIDQDYMKKNGMKTTFTYARGDDKNSDQYEYKAQWSFKDGSVYPTTDTWIKGSWEAVPLVLPLNPRTIEFECTPDDLKAVGVTRATLQVRYMRLGKEMETNIPIGVAQGQTLVKATIFTDPATRGYAYRIVYNQKDAGKLALDWDAKVNDDYVYVSVPDAFKDKTSDGFKKAIEIGQAATESPDGKVNDTSKVLDKFKDILGIVSK